MKKKVTLVLLLACLAVPAFAAKHHLMHHPAHHIRNPYIKKHHKAPKHYHHKGH